MSSDPSAKTRTKPLSKQEATEQLELEIDTLLNSIDDDLTKITETLTSSLDPEEASAQADAATQLALEDAAANPTATTSPETNLESTSDSTPEPDQVANESESNTDESTDEADPILEGQIDPEPVNEANLANDPGLGTEHAPEENPAEDLPVDEAASAVVETIAPPDPTPVV